MQSLKNVSASRSLRSQTNVIPKAPKNSFGFRSITFTPQRTSSLDEIKQYPVNMPIYPFKTTPEEDKAKEKKPLKDLLSAVTVDWILEEKHEPVVSISESATVYEAVREMSGRKVGSIIVTKKENPKEMTGIFTERDYLRKIVLKDLSSKITPITDVMTTAVKTAPKDWSLIDVIHAMAKGRFRHLPVTLQENPNTPIGIVSSRNVVDHFVGALHQCSDPYLAEDVKLNDIFNHLCRKSSRLCYVSTGDTVFKALQVMQDVGIGAVFVTKGTNLVGIFTERDYLNKIILQGKKSKDTKVKDVMTTNVITATPTESAPKVLSLMVEHNIRSVPVIPLLGQAIDYADGREYQTIGMITEMDLIRFAHYRLHEAEKEKKL